MVVKMDEKVVVYLELILAGQKADMWVEYLAWKQVVL
jgi:hypothetical protein